MRRGSKDPTPKSPASLRSSRVPGFIQGSQPSGVRLYRLKLVRVSKGRCAWADTAVKDYGKRLARHGSFAEIDVKPAVFSGDVDAVRATEAERLLKQVQNRDILVAVDERGESPDSHGLAAKLSELNLEGTVVFVVGGAYGLDASVRKQARYTLRLSNLVLNHEVARVVLYEQLYRSITLLEGIPYHH